MPYCPQDRIQFEEELEQCIICGGPLIEGVIEDIFDDVDQDAWVELDPLSDLAYGLKVRDALEMESIPCYLSTDVADGDACDGVATILVPESYYEEALSVQQSITPTEDDHLFIDPDAEDDW